MRTKCRWRNLSLPWEWVPTGLLLSGFCHSQLGFVDFRAAFSPSVAGNMTVLTFNGSLQHSGNSLGLCAPLTISWARER